MTDGFVRFTQPGGDGLSAWVRPSDVVTFSDAAEGTRIYLEVGPSVLVAEPSREVAILLGIAPPTTLAALRSALSAYDAAFRAQTIASMSGLLEMAQSRHTISQKAAEAQIKAAIQPMFDLAETVKAAIRAAGEGK